MKKQTFIFSVIFNGKSILSHTYSFSNPLTVQNLAFRCLALLYFLRSLLEYAVIKFNLKHSVGHLIVKVSSNSSSQSLLDIHGVMPGTAKEIDNILEKNEAKMRLFKMVLNSLLSQR